MTTIPDLDDPIVKHIRTDFVPLNADQTVAEALAQVRASPRKVASSTSTPSMPTTASSASCRPVACS